MNIRCGVSFFFLAVFSFSSVASDYLSDDLLLSDDLDVVLTPTRLKQRIADVPASVTVLNQDTFQRLGVRSVPEALRLVPGVVVGMAAGNEYRISYHGTNGLIPRRMQVLVDGMSVYRTGFAQIDWSMLNIDISNIDRIEVTRSPSSATYGANSFFGVVNIITKHPMDSKGVEARAYVGTLDTRDYSLNYGNSINKTDYRINLLHQEDSGFDTNFVGEERRDGTAFNALSIRSITNLSTSSSFDLQIGLSNAELQSEYVDSGQTTFPDKEHDEAYFLAEWSKDLSDKHTLKVKGYSRDFSIERNWNSCYPAAFFWPELRAMHAANPDYAKAIASLQVPSGGTAQDDALAAAVLSRIATAGAAALAPACVDLNERYDETQIDLEIEDSYIFSDRLRTILGGGIRNDSAESESFLNGEVSYFSSRLFGTAEYRLTDKTILNVGGMLEHEKEQYKEFAFSPRASINYHFNDKHTLRFVLSKAVRTPDMLENDRDWNYYGRNMTPPVDGNTEVFFYNNSKSDGTLVPEEILSKEISYYANIPELDLSWDFKVFEEKLSKLISEKLQFFDYYPSNSNSATLRGAEIQLNYRPTKRMTTYLAYAYMDNNSTNFYEKSMSPRHSGSAYISYDFAGDWQSSLAYYGSNDIGGFSYDRYDLVVSKFLRWNANRLDTSFIVRHYGNPDSGFVSSQTFSVINNYSDSTHYLLSLKYSL